MGKLVQPENGPAYLAIESGKKVALTGDEPTQAVLRDKRLAGMRLEALGHYAAPDRFEVDPIHTRALFVHKDGKRMQVTYWCDVCYIRTFSPGKCWCCQKETDLDLREHYEQ